MSLPITKLLGIYIIGVFASLLSMQAPAAPTTYLFGGHVTDVFGPGLVDTPAETGEPFTGVVVYDPDTAFLSARGDFSTLDFGFTNLELHFSDYSFSNRNNFFFTGFNSNSINSVSKIPLSVPARGDTDELNFNFQYLGSPFSLTEVPTSLFPSLFEGGSVNLLMIDHLLTMDVEYLTPERVTPVPIPGAIWFFGSALFSLSIMYRKFRIR